MKLNDKIRLTVKLLFSNDKELYSFFAGATGFCPRRIDLYKQACSHRSRQSRDNNNERMEYLGDALLNAIVADMLYARYKNRQEGFLTDARSKIVSRETLNRISEEIGLASHIMFTHPVSSRNCNMSGNALEALVAAVYLDMGYKRCRAFVERLIAGHVNVASVARKETNHKSKLIEWAQKRQVAVEFILTGTDYDPHKNPTFTSTVTLAGVEAGTGSGFTKRKSHQAAAKAALRRLKDPVFRSRVEAPAAAISTAEIPAAEATAAAATSAAETARAGRIEF